MSHFLTASGEDLTETDDPARLMMRQVAAAFAQYEKERLVRKLRGRARSIGRVGIGKVRLARESAMSLPAFLQQDSCSTTSADCRPTALLAELGQRRPAAIAFTLSAVNVSPPIAQSPLSTSWILTQVGRSADGEPLGPSRGHGDSRRRAASPSASSP
jgi:hypothetical protein